MQQCTARGGVRDAQGLLRLHPADRPAAAVQLRRPHREGPLDQRDLGLVPHGARRHGGHEHRAGDGLRHLRGGPGAGGEPGHTLEHRRAHRDAAEAVNSYHTTGTRTRKQLKRPFKVKAVIGCLQSIMYVLIHLFWLRV